MSNPTPTKKQYLFNFSWLFANHAIKILVGLFVGIWVARYLGKENYGILGQALSYYAMFTFLINFGLSGILQRELVSTPELRDRLMGSALILKLSGALLAVGLINLTAYLNDFSSVKFFLISIISFQALVQPLNITSNFFNSQVKSKYSVSSTLIALVLSSLTKILLIYYEAELIYFGFVFILEAITIAIMNLYFYKSNFGNPLSWKFSYKLAKVLLKDSWVIGLTAFFTRIHSEIDVLMIGELLGDGESGLYKVSNTLTSLSASLINTVLVSLLPYFVMMRNKDETLYKRRLQQLLSLSVWAGIVFGTLAIIFGQEAITLAYGDEYSKTYGAFAINIWSIIFIVQVVLINNWLVTYNLQRFQLYFNVFAAFLNIGLNIILIPKFGIAGAATATIITRLSIVWISPLFFKATRELGFMSAKSINPFLIYKFAKDYYKLKLKN